MLGFLARTKKRLANYISKIKNLGLISKVDFPQNFNCKAKTVKVAKLTGAVIGK